MFLDPQSAPLQLISDPDLNQSSVKLYIKREDLLHSYISGNKWRKLKYNLIEARELGFKKLLTFGGAYSNHISATAAAGKEFGFETIGVIRGEETWPLNPTLSYATNNGMALKYLSRNEYKRKNSEEIKNALVKIFGEFYSIPEGGSNALAVLGASEIIEDINICFDYICCPVGTGGTLAGLISSKSAINYNVLGFSALKNTGFLEEEVENLTRPANKKWSIQNTYHFGGYAKFNNDLIDFINKFKETNKIQLDPIYTGKMMYGIFDLIKKNYFAPNSVIIAIHTGGIQGIKGFNERFGSLIK